MRKRSVLLTILAALTGMTAVAQNSPNWDTSGNSMLHGTYYFRHVLWVIGYNTGDLGDGISVYGSITFDGNGNYSINGQVMDPSVNTKPQSYTSSGTYSISASGYGYMDNEYSSGDEVYGLVSNGIFIGSSTETGSAFNDLFIAAPLPNPAPTLGSLNGTYTMVGIDNPGIGSGGGIYSEDYQFTFTANGGGKISAVGPATGYINGNGGSLTQQSVGSINYTSSGGAFVLQFSGNQATGTNIIWGQKYLYMSPDGNFVFGGSPTGWDMVVGVKTSGGNQNFKGLYYQAGMDVDGAALNQGYGIPDSYYGSLVAGSGSYLFHQRMNNQFTAPYDFTGDDPLNPVSGGTVDPYNAQTYIMSTGGAYRIGFGQAPFVGIEVAIQAPSFTGSGVFVNPSGIEAAGNYALFTAGIAPGEVILINGSGFSTSNLAPTSATLPKSLGGTSVQIDGIPAALVYVTPNLIAAQVPYEIASVTTPIVGIQVITSKGSSNLVTLFQGDTQPGAYTFDASGVGAAAAYHAATFQPVTTSNPAVPGETLAVYLNGLGTVSPQVADGAPASSTSLTPTDFPIFADFLNASTGYSYPVGVTAAPTATTPSVCSNQDTANYVFGAGCPVTFSGLAPTYAGLYQANFVVPTNDGYGNPITTGNLILELQGLDSNGSYVESYSSQVVVPIKGTAASTTPATEETAAIRPRPTHPAIKQHKLTHRKGRVIQPMR
jgi:uncharacterized protein (TIGR03437 family)